MPTVLAGQELFNTVQFFKDGTNEYVRKAVSAEEAVAAAKHYTTSVAAQLGMVTEVMITDMMDCCCFHWMRGKGIVHPPPSTTRIHGEGDS